MARRGHPAYFIALLVAALCLTASSANQETEEGSNNFWTGLQLMYNSYQQCEQHPDMAACLKLKAIRSLDRALRKDSIPLIDGLNIAKSPEGSRAFLQPLQEVDERNLPQDPEGKQEKLDEMLVSRVERFFQGYTMQFSVPRFLTEQVTEEEEEGRGKKKKYGIALLALMMKGYFVALAYKGVALLAAKALMVAKIALVLAGIAALSKLGGHEGGKTTVEIVKHPHITHAYSHSTGHEHLGGEHYETSGGGGHGWGRSFDPATEASYMAYNGQLEKGEGQVESVPL